MAEEKKRTRHSQPQDPDRQEPGPQTEGKRLSHYLDRQANRGSADPPSTSSWGRMNLNKLLPLISWLALTAAAMGLVARYSSNVPAFDEWSMVQVATGHQPLTWAWLWSPWYVHRLPVPRLLLLGLYHATGLDFRAGCYAQAAMLSATALALMFTARKLRGRWSWTDMTIPLVILSPVHWFNWLNGWQIQFTLTVCLSLLLLPFHVFKRPLLFAMALACLPLCGLNGVVVAVPVACWLLWQRQWPGLVVLAEVGFYCVRLPNVEHDMGVLELQRGIFSRFQDLGELLGAQLGHGLHFGIFPSPWLSIPAIVLMIATVAMLAWEKLEPMEPRRRKLAVLLGCVIGAGIPILIQLPDLLRIKTGYDVNSWQVFGWFLLLACLLSALSRSFVSVLIGATLLLALSVLVGRRWGHWVLIDRYFLLWVPLPVCIYVSTKKAQAPLTIAMALVFISAVPFAQQLAKERHEDYEIFASDVHAGRPMQFSYFDATGLHIKYKMRPYYNPCETVESDQQALTTAWNRAHGKSR